MVSARRKDKLDALVAQHGRERVAAVPVDLTHLADLPDAVRRAEATSQEKMSGFTAGLQLPPGMKLPF